MPKPKPDEVVRHEIVLGRTEREMFETIVAGITFNRVATPTVALLSDVSALSALILILEATGVIDLDRGIFGEVLDTLYSNGYASYQELKDAADEAIANAEALVDYAQDPFKAQAKVNAAKTFVQRLGLAAIYVGNKLNPLN